MTKNQKVVFIELINNRYKVTQEVSRLISLSSYFARTANLFCETNDLDFLCSFWIGGSDRLGLNIFRKVLTIKIMKARTTDRRQ
jgi:hypothetical protein